MSGYATEYNVDRCDCAAESSRNMLPNMTRNMYEDAAKYCRERYEYTAEYSRHNRLSWYKKPIILVKTNPLQQSSFTA